VTPDRLRQFLDDAIEGRFPPADGGVTFVPPDAITGLEAVVSFTGHAIVATAMPPGDLCVLGIDGFGGAHAPDVLRGIAGPSGWIGALDVTLVCRGTGAGPGTLEETDRYEAEHRVVYARSTRAAVRVLSDARGFVTLGFGLAGRLELGVEVHNDRRALGLGRALLRDALGVLPHGEPVFAACAPGNARSLRALLSAGFTPIGAEVLIRPER
jgi:GNAT superfamily N-acetyltransferase